MFNLKFYGKYPDQPCEHVGKYGTKDKALEEAASMLVGDNDCNYCEVYEGLQKVDTVHRTNFYGRKVGP